MGEGRQLFSEEQISALSCWTNFSWHNLFRTSKYICAIYAKIILFEHLQKLSAVTSQSLYSHLHIKQIQGQKRLNSGYNFANL